MSLLLFLLFILILLPLIGWCWMLLMARRQMHNIFGKQRHSYTTDNTTTRSRQPFATDRAEYAEYEEVAGPRQQSPAVEPSDNIEPMIQDADYEEIP